MSQATFYLLHCDATKTAENQIIDAACQLTYDYYKNNQLIYIHCQNKQQAFAVDEMLWQFEPDSFVPHNLKGEGPAFGAPVEIGFDQSGPNKNRQVLINLADQCPSFAVNFGHIIDFVASDDAMKAIARERYKQYRTMGIKLATQNLATSPII